MGMTEISINGEMERFKQHLSLPFNERIIFSAKFGTGKTYFIDNYFTGNSDFNFVRISPINYPLIENKDIFDLIRYDILDELIWKYHDKFSLECLDPTFLETLNSCHFDISKGISNILTLISIVDNDLTRIAAVSKALDVLKTSFDKKFGKVKVRLDKNEFKSVDYFMKEVETSQFFLHDSLIDEIIISIVNQVKKVVFIIDDLDRMDPDHLFRIINIFGTHFEHKSNKKNNKFDFEKIIFICDIVNIREMFYHKYGKNVDFYGYLDKFFSWEIFHFDNHKSTLESLKDIFNKQTTTLVIHNNSKHKDSEFDKLFFKTLNGIIYELIQNQQLNLRVLLKFVNNEPNIDFVNISYQMLYYSNSTVQEFSTHKWLFILHVEYLIKLFGSFDYLYSVFMNLAQSNPAVVITKNNVSFLTELSHFIYNHANTEVEKKYLKSGYTFKNYEFDNIINSENRKVLIVSKDPKIETEFSSIAPLFPLTLLGLDIFQKRILK